MKEYTVKVFEDGSKVWYLDGQRHREDGPAIELSSGTKAWYLDGKYHREDGPAIERADGRKEWYLNGKLHREDGPAIERADGTQVWYLNGNHLTEEDHRLRRTYELPLLMPDALAAGDPVILNVQAERVAELEEEVERLRAKKKQIYEDLQDAVESEWVQTRMMLAAPELLEALRTMLEMSEMGGFGKAYAEDVARAAIAKAKGE